MTSTEKLRAMLDERGVEHYDGWSGEIRYTKWQGNYGMWFLTYDSFGTDGKLLYVQGIDMTPEQAIEATLGRGECRIEAHFGEWYCTGCGVMVGTCDPDSELCVDGNYVGMWSYCPNCGRKVRA